MLNDNDTIRAILSYFANRGTITICPPCRYSSPTALKQSRRVKPSAATRRAYAMRLTSE